MNITPYTISLPDLARLRQRITSNEIHEYSGGREYIRLKAEYDDVKKDYDDIDTEKIITHLTKWPGGLSVTDGSAVEYEVAKEMKHYPFAVHGYVLNVYCTTDTYKQPGKKNIRFKSLALFLRTFGTYHASIDVIVTDVQGVTRLEPHEWRKSKELENGGSRYD